MTSTELGMIFVGKANKVYVLYVQRVAKYGALDGKATELWGRFDRYVEAVRYLLARGGR